MLAGAETGLPVTRFGPAMAGSRPAVAGPGPSEENGTFLACHRRASLPLGAVGGEDAPRSTAALPAPQAISRRPPPRSQPRRTSAAALPRLRPDLASRHLARAHAGGAPPSRFACAAEGAPPSRLARAAGVAPPALLPRRGRSSGEESGRGAGVGRGGEGGA